MLFPDFQLHGKVAMVTGASRGIGYGLALSLAQAGAHVAVAARNVRDSDGLVQEIQKLGVQVLAVALDLNDIDRIPAVIARVVAHFGQLDILVNNAGLGSNKAALEVTESEWDEMMSINLKGTFFCCQAAARHMLPRKQGRIINISSQASLVGIRDHAVYCASKGGLNQLTRVLALEWSPEGITVNAVAPTFIYTPGTAERLDQPEYLAGVVARIPIGHVGTIADVAGAVVYLASSAGAMVYWNHLTCRWWLDGTITRLL